MGFLLSWRERDTPIDLHLKSDPGAAKRLTAESLTPLLRGRITGVDALAK